MKVLKVQAKDDIRRFRVQLPLAFESTEELILSPPPVRNVFQTGLQSEADCPLNILQSEVQSEETRTFS